MTTHKTITFTADKSVIAIYEKGVRLGEILYQFGGISVQRWGDKYMTSAAGHAFEKTKGIHYETKAEARKEFVKFYDIACKRLRIDDARYNMESGLDSSIWYDGAIIGKIKSQDGVVTIFADSGRAPDFLKDLAVGKTFKGYNGAKRAIIAAAQEAGFDDDIPPPANPDKDAGEPLLVDWKEYNPDKVINDQDLVNIRGLSALTALSLRLNFVSEKDKSGVNVVLDGRAIALLYCDDDDTAKISWYAGNDKLDGLWDAEATTDQLSCGLGDGGIRRAQKIISGALLFYGV